MDVGERRIGVALGFGALASPLKILTVRSQEEVAEELAELCKEEQISQVVVGFPLDREGEETLQARKVKKFVKALQKRIDAKIKIVFWNEALSSKEAVKSAVELGRPPKKRKRVDDLAAALILQDFLDSQR